MTNRHCVFWDGECGMCEKALQWIHTRDKGGIFQLMPYQTAPEPPMTPELRKACKRALHVVAADGQVYRGARAVLFILERSGWGMAARWMSVPPMIWLFEIVYRLIAYNRHRFSRPFKAKECHRNG